MIDKKFPNLSLLEGIHSTPSRRYLSEELIDDEIIWNIIDAAIRGPSGGNKQDWGWIVIKDKNTKNQIAKLYLESWNKSYGNRRDSILNNLDNDALGPRNFLSAEHLANHISDAPVWIVPILRYISKSKSPITGSSIYGAIQNLMLAARAYGIGSTLTALHTAYEEDVKKILNIPDDAMTMALIPLGYPIKGKWSQPKRKPVESVTYWELWNTKKNRI
ncbi:MAG: nitroreductase [Chloroflexi bacterium]|nr:nitroreductase [Chloroflexota bacterium]|tara:strand:- start:2517 stop:3170 length:654 start_codon:yes stop_codon:yes gene_type:complete